MAESSAVMPYGRGMLVTGVEVDMVVKWLRLLGWIVSLLHSPDDVVEELCWTPLFYIRELQSEKSGQGFDLGNPPTI